MDPAVFSAEQKDLFNKIDTEIKKFNPAWSLESIGIGKSSGNSPINGLVFTFYTNTAKTKTNTAGLAFTSTRPGYGKMNITYSAASKVDKNMENVAKTAPDVETFARSFATTLNGTYDITPDNYFLPTGGAFTAVEGGTSFKLN